MSRYNPENSYIRNIDQPPAPHQPHSPENKTGRNAEQIVMEFFQEQFPELKIREASQEEDRGHTGIDSGKQIDAVLYRENKPEAALQITTAMDSKIRTNKLSQLKDHPFLRLEEMDRQEPNIPKALIFLEPSEVEAFMTDHDWAKHPKLVEQILNSLENSLKFVMLQTKNPKEIEKAKLLLETVKFHKNTEKKEDKLH